MSTALLLAEPKPDQRGLLERRLRNDGFDVVGADGGYDILELAERARPDLLVLNASFADLCGRLRAGEPGRSWDRDVPVILVADGATEPVERVRALQRGADDYVAHPYVYDELVERIRAVLRRSGPPARQLLEAAEIRIDGRTRLVTVNGARVLLSAKEYALLVCLAGDPERLYTKAELLRELWGINQQTLRTRTLESHASRLRRKLAEYAEQEYVVNEWGVGYRLLEVRPVPPAAQVIGIAERRR